MQTFDVIVEKKDRRNRLLIAKSFLWVSHHKRQSLLDFATPEERAVFVNKHNRRLFIGLVLVGLYFAISALWPREPRQAPIASIPIQESAGTVQRINLHSTAFSTDTTVETSSGMFQVRGGVSAAVGDSAKLSTDQTTGFKIKSLCIESKIKTACYQLL